MSSLIRYLEDGIGILFWTFLIAAALYNFINLLHKSVNRTKLNKSSLLVLWYFLSLESVSFFYNIGNSFRTVNLEPFAWVRDAVETGPVCVWQLILNFLLYIPLGIILAANLKNKGKIKLPLIIAGISLFNETLQYIFSLGSTDIDDLIVNVCGGLWGIALYHLFIKLKNHKELGFSHAVSVSTPFIAILILTLLYFLKPYGYIPADFASSNIKVDSVYISPYDRENYISEAGVYKAKTYKPSQVYEITSRIFSVFGEKEDIETYDMYDDVLVTHGTDYRYYSWCWNDGRFSFSTMEKGIAMDYPDEPMIERVRHIISDIGLDLPKLSSNDDLQIIYNEYTVNYNLVPYNEYLYYGKLKWEAYDDMLYELECDVLPMSSTGKTQKMDYETFCKNLQNGNFYCNDLKDREIHSLSCSSCILEYEKDSKGFYRPVYILRCIADGEYVIVKMPFN